MDVILNINNLKYNNIFKDLSIYIEKNTITAISGSNNCGKTTLMRILSRNIKTNTNIVYRGKEIKDYKQENYNNKVQVVFPEEILFQEKAIIDEMKIQKEEIDTDKIDFLISKLSLKKIQNKDISSLSTKEIVLMQIAKAILNAEDIVMIDEIDNYFTKEELINLYKVFNQCIDKYDLTFIITCLNLESTLYVDELYIISNGKILIKGEPLRVLDKDNILNKEGLEVPFIIDLSVKLKDYQLINKIILNQEEMIEELWN